MKKSVLLFLFVFNLNNTAHAGAMAGGASEITQIANNVQLIMSYTEQARQTVTQLNQYQAMLRNLKNLTPDSALQLASQKLWQNQNMNQTFKDLFHVVNDGQRIVYNSQALDRQLKNMNPGYGNALGGFDFQNAYKNWSETTNDVLSSALKQTSVQAEDLQTEGELISNLNNMSQSVDGQVQAISAGNQIGIAMVGQMQKLRQLQISQANAQQMAAINANSREQVTDELVSGVIGGGCSKLRTLAEIRSKDPCK